MDCSQFDIRQINAEKLGVSNERWGRYIEMIVDVGCFSEMNIFSDNGASYVDVETKTIRTAFTKKEFNENIIKALEVLNKYGR